MLSAMFTWYYFLHNTKSPNFSSNVNKQEQMIVLCNAALSQSCYTFKDCVNATFSRVQLFTVKKAGFDYIKLNHVCM